MFSILSSKTNFQNFPASRNSTGNKHIVGAVLFLSHANLNSTSVTQGCRLGTVLGQSCCVSLTANFLLFSLYFAELWRHLSCYEFEYTPPPLTPGTHHYSLCEVWLSLGEPWGVLSAVYVNNHPPLPSPGTHHYRLCEVVAVAWGAVDLVVVVWDEAFCWLPDHVNERYRTNTLSKITWNLFQV